MKEQKPFGRHSTVVTPGRVVPVESLSWNPPPKFVGAFLRHLVTGDNTWRRMSLHHVWIDPGCAIGDHVHAGQGEIEHHQVGRALGDDRGDVAAVAAGFAAGLAAAACSSSGEGKYR